MISRKQNSNLVHNAAFIFSLVVVVTSLVSVIFPTLIIRLTSPSTTSPVSPFDVGTLALPVVASNVFIFGLGILYYKKNLPNYLIKSINFILNFEISRRIAIIVIASVLGIYVIFTINQLTIDEGILWEDYVDIVKPILKLWPTQHVSNYEISEQLQRHVRAFLLVASNDIFHNDKVIPYLTSISILFLTYFITKQISGKRFAGIISMIIVAQSYTFLRYSASATYDNFWVAFYLLSIYSLYRKWYLSPISYVLSIFSKIISAPYLLLTLFFIYKLDIIKKKKYLLLILYVIAVIVSVIIIKLGGFVYQQFVNLDYNSFWVGLTMWANQLRFDFLIELTILPLVVGLYFLSKKGIPEADSMLIMIGGLIINQPLLSIMQSNLMQPYRMVSFVVFFAISLGILLSKIKKQDELKHDVK